MSEVLTAVNASANHGTLLYILRKVTVAMDSEDGKITYTEEIGGRVNMRSKPSFLFAEPQPITRKTFWTPCLLL